MYILPWIPLSCDRTRVTLTSLHELFCYCCCCCFFNLPWSASFCFSSHTNAIDANLVTIHAVVHLQTAYVTKHELRGIFIPQLSLLFMNKHECPFLCDNSETLKILKRLWAENFYRTGRKVPNWEISIKEYHLIFPSHNWQKRKYLTDCYYLAASQLSR